MGNITEIEDVIHETIYHAGDSTSAKNTFVYDALYRLKEATGREHHSLPANAPQYGQEWFNARQVHVNDTEKATNYTRRYSYDLGNNLTLMQHISSDNQRRYKREITVEEGSNRALPASMLPPVSPQDIDINDPLKNPNAASFDDFFDKNGNMKSLDHLVKLEWNYSNNISRAVVIERNDGTIDDAEYYIYDSSGNRVRKITETWKENQIERRETIYLGGVEIKKTFHQTPGVQAQLKKERVDHHVMDDTKRIAIVNTWTFNDLSSGELAGTVRIRYQYSNHLGSASLELNDIGEFVSYQEYFPFGETAYTYGTVSTEYRFTGKERDEFTGLYYFGARYYAPWMFRWMNPDPSGPVDGLNVFVYVSNQPIVMVDPDGRLKFKAPNLPSTPGPKYKKAVDNLPNGRKKSGESRVVKKKYPDQPNAFIEGCNRSLEQLEAIKAYIKERTPGLRLPPNWRYADSSMKVILETDETFFIPFDKMADPDFEAAGAALSDKKFTMEGLTGKHAKDEKLMRQEYIKRFKERPPEGYTFHHAKDNTVLLVRTDVHSSVAHRGWAAHLRALKILPFIMAAQHFRPGNPFEFFKLSKDSEFQGYAHMLKTMATEEIVEELVEKFAGPIGLFNLMVDSGELLGMSFDVLGPSQDESDFDLIIIEELEEKYSDIYKEIYNKEYDPEKYEILRSWNYEE